MANKTATTNKTKRTTKTKKPAANNSGSSTKETTKPEDNQEQPKFKRLIFPDQMKAYNWLLWECPKEYVFTTGVNSENGTPCVEVLIKV